MPFDSAATRPLVDANDSQLMLTSAALTAGETLAFEPDSDDTFLFVVDGTAIVSTGSNDSSELLAGGAAFFPSGAEAALRAGADGTNILCVKIGAGCDEHAPLGPVDHFAAFDEHPDGEATGNRMFQVFFGPENGSCRATFFVGHVPPGKAPWHFHNYDEIVWIWKGNARFHSAAGASELPAGSAIRLRRRQVHSVENVSTDSDLTLLGIFTPAGSPAAAFLADSP